jgi:sulfur-carrier protein adenylyltransferase/sulfurtransferase
MLTQSELNRYSRHLLIPEFGINGQLRLKNSKVLVIGCGGLGSPVLLYLAAAGIGTIGLIDNDLIDDSNLQRQVLFDTASIGKPKVEAATKRLQALNPYITLIPYEYYLDASNALAIFDSYDLIIDGSDNFQTRYLVNDACVLLGKPFVYGAIHRFEGQVAIFNYQNGSNYRDLFATPPPPELAPNCAEAGVLGVLPGIIGCLQANEAIKLLAQIGEPLTGRLFVIDALTLTSRTIRIPKSPDSPKITALIDYEVFCDVSSSKKIVEISVQELQKLIKNKADFQLIDVREANEYELANLGGELMPLSELENFVSVIDRNKTVVVHCQSGVRSRKAIEYLIDNHGFTNLQNLTGGLSAYQKMTIR